MVTIRYIRELLTEIMIAAEDGGNDIAHALEDGLMVDTLETIARGGLSAEEAQALAREALRSSEEIEFSRGCEP